MANLKGITGKVTEPITPTHHKIPQVTTANRPGEAGGINADVIVTAGMLVFNTTIGTLQQLAQIGPNAWVSIDSPPVVSSISPTTLHTTGQAFTITGSNFTTTVSAVAFIGQDDVSVAAASFSRASSTSITGTSPVLPIAQEPYTVKVTNATDLYGTLSDAVDAGGSPTWTAFLAGLTGTGQATSGLIASISDSATGTHDTLAAVDPDGAAVTYAATGSGVWAGRNIAIASNGVVSGDPTNESATATTYTQAVRATDSGGNTTDQNLQILVIAAPSVTGNFSSATAYSGYVSYYCGSGSNNTAMNGTFVTYGNTLVDIFMVGGGAGGSPRHGGGGGAGGAITATGVLLPAGTYTVAGGAGGAAISSGDVVGNTGVDVTVAGISGGTWSGKGGGGGAPHGSPDNAGAGGCGGGAGLPSGSPPHTHTGGASTQAANTPSFGGASISVHGYAGATTNNSTHNQAGGGGGGGGGGMGLAGSSALGRAGLGGPGITNSYRDNTNNSTAGTGAFAGGGGGGGHAFSGTPAGGSGGGGAGSASGASGSAGTNFAGGGGGGGGGNTTTGASGGNGIVVIRHTA